MEPSDAGFRTLYFGFGVEGIGTQAEQDDVICRRTDYLGVACP